MQDHTTDAVGLCLVGSTKSDIRVEICSNCHPFFTGKQKLVDTAGRIERFRRKYEKFQKKEETS